MNLNLNLVERNYYKIELLRQEVKTLITIQRRKFFF